MAEKERPNLGVNEPEAKPSIVQKVLDKRNEWAAEQPSFSGQLEALWREGLKDVQNAVLHAFPESQRGVDEPGTPLNPTPQQVTHDLGNLHGYDAQLAEYASRPSRSNEKGMERD